MAAGLRRHLVALDRKAVEHDGPDALLAAVGIYHRDRVLAVAEAARDREALPVLRNARIDDETVVVRTDAEDELRDGVPVPRRRAGEPRVLRLARLRRVASGDHLRIDVGLDLVELRLLLGVARADLRVMVPRVGSAAGHRLGDDHPRVVVAEDARVFLVARRIRRDLAVFDDVLRERRLVEDDAVPACEATLDGVTRLLGHPLVLAD